MKGLFNLDCPLSRFCHDPRDVFAVALDFLFANAGNQGAGQND